MFKVIENRQGRVLPVRLLLDQLLTVEVLDLLFKRKVLAAVQELVVRKDHQQTGLNQQLERHQKRENLKLRDLVGLQDQIVLVDLVIDVVLEVR